MFGGGGGEGGGRGGMCSEVHSISKGAGTYYSQRSARKAMSWARGCCIKNVGGQIPKLTL